MGTHQSWLGARGVREAGQGLGGGCKGFGSGGVGGRDTGPRDGANFATCVVFLSFLKDALWGGGVGGGTQTKGLGCRRGLGGGRRGDGSSKEGGGLGLVGCSKEGRGQGRVGLAVGGGARASVAG